MASLHGLLNPVDAATRSVVSLQLWEKKCDQKIWMCGLEFLLETASDLPASDLPWMATTAELKHTKQRRIPAAADPFD